MKVTLTILSKLENKESLTNLFEAMNKSGIHCDASPNLDKVIVDLDRQSTAVRILNLHGFEVQREKVSHLSGAMQELSEKYQIDEIFGMRKREEEPDPQVYQVKIDKKKLVGFLQRTIRETHGKRKKKRATHARDELNGEIRAYEKILRKVRKL